MKSVSSRGRGHKNAFLWCRRKESTEYERYWVFEYDWL